MPDFRVVSEQSEEEIARKRAEEDRKRAEEDLSYPLRELAANLIRVVRGAGKSYELLPQMMRVINAATAYQQAHGAWPASHTLDDILCMSGEVEEFYQRVKNGRASEADLARWHTDGTYDRAAAIDAICRGALQKCASELIGQTVQERAGERELLDGILAMEDVRERRRKASRVVVAVKKTPRNPKKRTPVDL